MLTYTPTPIQEIFDPLLDQHGIRLLIKREDQNHPLISGNKWWKLKYNLEEAKRLNKNTLLTFGGAYSNHIYATAAAASECGFQSIGIIRGEKTLPLNPTLQFAIENGMKLHYVDREAYRRKSEPGFINKLHDQFGDFYLIPEGGTNELAVKGTTEFAREHLSKIAFDSLFLPVGTGGTIAGIINGLKGDKQVVGIPVLKNGGFLEEEIKRYLNGGFSNWSLLTEYHHGGYAKTTPALLVFIKEMEIKHQLPLDHVYTGKLLWAVMEEIKKGMFQKGSTILALHTGGLQGSNSKTAYY